VTVSAVDKPDRHLCLLVMWFVGATAAAYPSGVYDSGCGKVAKGASRESNIQGLDWATLRQWDAVPQNDRREVQNWALFERGGMWKLTGPTIHPGLL